MSEIDDINSDEFAELTGFQRDILVILAGDKVYKGLEVKDELEAYYDEDVNHGRLYPNLDSLKQKGLISKVKIDNRTNGYDIAPTGEAHLRQRLNWERSRWDHRELSPKDGASTESKSDETETHHESEEVASRQTEAPKEMDQSTGIDENKVTQDDSEALIDDVLRQLSNLDKPEDSDR